MFFFDRDGVLIKNYGYVYEIKKYNLNPSECFMIGDEKKDYLSSMKTKILFQFKKKYSLYKQVKNIAI